MSPRALGAPLHRHSREDEYSYVLEGRVGALLGDEVAEGGPGDLIFKPRNQWHTFWNAGDTARPAARDHLPGRLRAVTSPSSSSSEGLLELHRRTWLRSPRDTDSRSTQRAFPSSSGGSSWRSPASRSSRSRRRDGVHLPPPRHALQLVLAARLEDDPRARGEVGDRPETRTSPAPPSAAIRAPVCTAMPATLVTAELYLARVNACAHFEPDRPNGVADRACAAHCASGPVERCEEAVARRVDLAAAVALELCANKRVVPCEQLRSSRGRRARQHDRSNRRCR